MQKELWVFRLPLMYCILIGFPVLLFPPGSVKKKKSLACLHLHRAECTIPLLSGLHFCSFCFLKNPQLLWSLKKTIGQVLAPSLISFLTHVHCFNEQRHFRLCRVCLWCFYAVLPLHINLALVFFLVHCKWSRMLMVVYILWPYSHGLLTIYCLSRFVLLAQKSIRKIHWVFLISKCEM